MNIAVVGSGISGLSAAWLLSKRHNVTVIESEDYLGGHANTVEVETPYGTTPVDTGFIVYNEQNYPNLSALFKNLDVPTSETEMSFALSFNSGEYEYGGSDASGYFGQRRNILRPRHWRLLKEISRFFRTAQDRIQHYPAYTSLGSFLDQERYSEGFVMDHIVPMGASIWSTTMERMREFPASGFINFYANHGMLQFNQRPDWRTVAGGSRNYVDRIVKDGKFQTILNCPVDQITRVGDHVFIKDKQGVIRPFDHVVLATHADQALKLLKEPDPHETRILGAFGYQTNIAVLHRDPRWMPRRRKLWSSWNYLKDSSGYEPQLCMTYWMNRLQKLNTKTDLFVTLNPTSEINAKAVDRAFSYQHPVFSYEAIRAQDELWSLQGSKRTWFCGSYFGYGFHEDGAQSGLAVAEQLGGVRRPWNVENESGRIKLGATTSLEAAE